MASKLEKHTELIASRLGNGVSIAAIAAELTATGTQTTAQNLGRWLKSRQARIKNRNELVGQLIAGHQSNLN